MGPATQLGFYFYRMTFENTCRVHCNSSKRQNIKNKGGENRYLDMDGGDETLVLHYRS